MKHLHYAATLAAVIACGAPASAQDCGLKEFASLDLSRAVSNLAVIDASLGDKPVRFLIDTGGYFSLLDKGTANALGLQSHATRGFEMVDVAGGLVDHYVSIPDLKMGPITLSDVEMMVDTRPMGVDQWDGTLAPDILNHFEVDFDFAAHKFNLFSQDHCDGHVVYWAAAYVDVPFRTLNNHIVFGVNLDGHDLYATLDTGSSYSTISTRLLPLFGLSEGSAGMEPVPESKPDDLIQRRYHFKKLSLDGVAVNNPLFYILPDKMDAALRNLADSDKMAADPIYGAHTEAPQIILGMDVLARLHLFISYKEKKLYLTAADAH
jgi:predicted aspartyl protease